MDIWMKLFAWRELFEIFHFIEPSKKTFFSASKILGRTNLVARKVWRQSKRIWTIRFMNGVYVRCRRQNTWKNNYDLIFSTSIFTFRGDTFTFFLYKLLQNKCLSNVRKVTFLLWQSQNHNSQAHSIFGCALWKMYSFNALRLQARAKFMFAIVSRYATIKRRFQLPFL